MHLIARICFRNNIQQNKLRYCYVLDIQDEMYRLGNLYSRWILFSLSNHNSFVEIAGKSLILVDNLRATVFYIYCASSRMHTYKKR